MKITGVKTYVLQGMIEDKSFGWSQRVTNSRQAVLCVVSTDEGITGVGEAFYFGGPAKIRGVPVLDQFVDKRKVDHLVYLP